MILDQSHHPTVVVGTQSFHPLCGDEFDSPRQFKPNLEKLGFFFNFFSLKPKSQTLFSSFGSIIRNEQQSEVEGWGWGRGIQEMSSQLLLLRIPTSDGTATHDLSRARRRSCLGRRGQRSVLRPSWVGVSLFKRLNQFERAADGLFAPSCLFISQDDLKKCAGDFPACLHYQSGPVVQLVFRCFSNFKCEIYLHLQLNAFFGVGGG